MDNRDEFEQWIKDTAEKHEYAFMDRILRRNGDDYATTWVDSAWMGWQAGRSDSWLLRKQAETLESEANDWEDDKTRQVAEDIRDSAQRLRQQADEAENG